MLLWPPRSHSLPLVSAQWDCLAGGESGRLARRQLLDLFNRSKAEHISRENRYCFDWTLGV